MQGNWLQDTLHWYWLTPCQVAAIVLVLDVALPLGAYLYATHRRRR